MKLDPGMHIGMHLVSFGKSGVTEWYQSCIDCRT
jgi:predicted DNA-binding transcriptional regulator AlpA